MILEQIKYGIFDGKSVENVVDEAISYEYSYVFCSSPEISH